MLETNVVGIIGPENPILRAALDGTSAIVAMESGKCDTLGQTLLRNTFVGGHYPGSLEPTMTLEEKLQFSFDPTMNATSDEIIQDDLSDRLFGDFGTTEDEEMVEDDYQLGTVLHQQINND